MTWKERIERAREVGYFTPDDDALAGSFCTCAVGEKAGLEEGNDPEFMRDLRDLWQLGLDFLDAVLANDADRADWVYQQIQAHPPVELPAKGV